MWLYVKAGCFPDMSKAWQRKIEKEYYHWFCNYFVQTLKLLTICRENIMRRMRFENVFQYA